MIQVSIAGSTGSVGTQALDVIGSSAGEFEVVALSADSNVQLLARQANMFRPGLLGVSNGGLVQQLRELLDYSPEIIGGDEALVALAGQGEVVLNAVVGFAGLPVTTTALSLGKRLALANKESLVAGGAVVQRYRSSGGGEIVPVDSEHSAIHQALRSSDNSVKEVRSLIVTASGGPFRTLAADELGNVTLEDALAHPTWSMGPKISVDSSTLMNKGLEVIEAHELFGIDFDDIKVVVHPQSQIHSMVEFTDGSAIAQISGPDMRLPIGYALSYPRRMATSYGSLDWSKVHTFEFEPPNLEKFPSLSLAYRAGKMGGGAPAWLNASNEVAVSAFIDGMIKWTEIYRIVEASMDKYVGTPIETVEDVLELDGAARAIAKGMIGR